MGKYGKGPLDGLELGLIGGSRKRDQITKHRFKRILCWFCDWLISESNVGTLENGYVGMITREPIFVEVIGKGGGFWVLKFFPCGIQSINALFVHWLDYKHSLPLLFLIDLPRQANICLYRARWDRNCLLASLRSSHLLDRKNSKK